MTKQWRFRVSALVLLLASTGAFAQGPVRAGGADVQVLTDAGAREVAALIGQPGFADAVRSSLHAVPEQGVSVQSLMGRFDPQAHTLASAALAAGDRQLRQRKGLPAQGQ
ncbi:hypothetical protein CEJ63_25045, partial [Acinetobacter baumannii]